jgi:eukaryotic-like serine/threonine-protein kinase
MLTGKRLFDGKTTSDVLAAVIRDEPDLNEVPGKVRPLLKRCLEKDPQRRLRDIGDVRGILDNTPEPTRAARPWAPWVLAAALLVALAALAFIHFREGSHEPPLITTSILPTENTSFDFSTDFDPPALSPDGRRMVFGARGAKKQLWVRSLGSITAQPLAGTEDAKFPFWSPDSRSVGFFAEGKLKRMDIAGGPALALASAPTPFGGTWSPAGVIVYCADVSGPLQRIPAGGGAPVPATTMGGNHWAHRTPWFLPDGRHFLYSDQASAGLADVTIRIGSLDSKEVETVGPASSAALYSSGYLLYLRQDTLIAQPFDEKRRITTGDAMPVAEHVWSMLSFSQRLLGVFSVSREGLLVYQTGETNTEHQLTWFSRNGKRLETLGEPGDFRGLDLSPDGKTVAATRLSGNTDIWTYDVARLLASRFTFGSLAHQTGVWSADGRRIAFQAELHAHLDLYQKASDGTGNDELLYADEATKVPLSWAPDGKFLLFFRIDPTLHTQRDIWLLRLDPASKPKADPWLATPFNERFAKFSPDGHWVAYESDDSGRYEIYVAPFPGPGGKRQISTGGGTFPRWRRDGKEIFYAGADGTLMATQVSIKGVAVDVGATESLRIPIITSAFYLYDVSTDGQLFLVAAPREQQSVVPLTLVQNWTALLKK